MKKSLVWLLILTMMLTMVLVGCGKEKTTEKDVLFKAGTYEGEGKGHAGVIKVSVKVTETEIESIEIIEFHESEFAVDPADQLIAKIIKANSGQVDGISGASLTSAGVLEAVNNALSKAYVEGAEGKAIETTSDLTVKLEDKETDVVIIGAGGAGLTAAIEASQNGAKVIVVEKMPMVGGNTKYATGGLNAAETSVQKEKGIDDTVEIFIEDTMVGGGNINNPELVRVLAENSAATVDWLIGLGADLSDVGRMGGASKDRTHRPTGGAPVGQHIVDVLYAEAQEMGIEILLESKVVEILGDSTAVNGVVVETADGNFNINAKAVIIASGGFSADNELVSQYDASLKGYGTTNHPGATGDVLTFASKLDVAYVDMEQIQTHPTVMPSNNYMITEAVRGNGAILVNREAKRFVNELDTRAVVSDALLAQEGATGYLFFDQSVRESLSAIEGYYKKGFLIEGADLDEIAGKLSLDPTVLKATIETYNSYVETGVDVDFARQDMARALNVGPYYAVEVAPAVHHTMGGLKINVNGEVLNSSETPIKGLYAAGEVTGGVHGNNRLGGNAMADITIFGRIAGKNAALSIK